MAPLAGFFLGSRSVAVGRIHSRCPHSFVPICVQTRRPLALYPSDDLCRFGCRSAIRVQRPALCNGCISSRINSYLGRQKIKMDGSMRSGMRRHSLFHCTLRWTYSRYRMCSKLEDTSSLGHRDASLQRNCLCTFADSLGEACGSASPPVPGVWSRSERNLYLASSSPRRRDAT